LLREYTVLIDPPAFDTSSPVVSASERVAEVDGEPAPVKKTEDPAVTSGTRVDVLKSDLAPGEMPQRDFSADTSPTPVPGARYMIKRDETLWEIALAAKPDGANVNQAMLDIQRLNPEAFIDGNINRIKAGYIVYLPSAEDISSDDLAAALEEVRQQNDDWRASKAVEPGVTAAASLRISADPVAPEVGGGDDAATDVAAGAAAAAAAMEDLEKAELEKADAEGQLAAMSDRVETLERIVSLKDEQIAALQAALDEANGGAATGTDTMPGDAGSEPAMVEEPADAAAATAPAATQPAAAPQPAPTPQPQPARQPAADEGGLGSWLYIGGAAILALLAGLFFWRRKSEEDSELLRPTATQAQPVSRSTAFEGVQLKEQKVEVETAPAEAPVAAAAPEPVEEPAVPEAPQGEEMGTGRGYGEERHDKYADDVDTGDALAEADIYIAYGRHSQAIDLLKTAIGNEPENAAYRLKLIELYVDQGERDEAAGQLTELRSRGDADAIARAESIMSGGTGAGAVTETPQPAAEPAAARPVPTVGAPSGAGALAGDQEPEALESDFSGLEIEEGDGGEEVADELDLSDDFSGGNGEEMVFAAEGNQMSTKLDLARAYMDMGDEDGARQILEEVIAEGSEEQQDEARQLLARIG
jgi:pilus assembly protein FimV